MKDTIKIKVEERSWEQPEEAYNEDIDYYEETDNNITKYDIECKVEINGKEIKYDPTERRVNAGDKKMSVLEFLLKLNIGLHEGGFDIEEYILANDGWRKQLDEENEPTN